MRNKRIAWLLTAVLLVLATVVSVGSVYARYREEISGDFIFQAGRPEKLTIAEQKWRQIDNDYVLTFAMEREAECCRIYLAASQGVVLADDMDVFLTIPGDEPIILEAVVEPIEDTSGLYSLFGPGYVFRFTDSETGEELTLDLSTEVYTMTVRGLDSAAEQTSLLRLFIEYAPE